MSLSESKSTREQRHETDLRLNIITFRKEWPRWLGGNKGALLLGRTNYQLKEEGFAEEERIELVRTSQRSAPFPPNIVQARLQYSDIQLVKGTVRRILCLQKALSNRMIKLPYLYLIKRFHVSSSGGRVINPYSLSHQLHWWQTTIYLCRSDT